jgi:hypothetical protein
MTDLNKSRPLPALVKGRRAKTESLEKGSGDKPRLRRLFQEWFRMLRGVAIP